MGKAVLIDKESNLLLGILRRLRRRLVFLQCLSLTKELLQVPNYVPAYELRPCHCCIVSTPIVGLVSVDYLTKAPCTSLPVHTLVGIYVEPLTT